MASIYLMRITRICQLQYIRICGILFSVQRNGEKLMERFHRESFRIFLLVYTGFLLWHARELDWGTPLTWLAVGSGLLLAGFAHRRNDVSTIVLLAIHMGIEWYSYAEHGAHFSGSETMLQLVHTALDLVFLWVEVRTHLSAYRYRVFFGIIASLCVLFMFNYSASPYEGFATTLTLPHEHHDSLLEAMVIGGILGCSLSHLLRKRTK
jgi:hypothetical protein